MMELLPGGAELMKLGALGVLLFFMSGVAWNLLKRLNDCWAARAEDLKSMQEVITSTNVTMAAVTASSDARTRSVEAMSKATELAAAAQLNMAGEVARLRDALERRGG